MKTQINNPNPCQPSVTDNGEAVESRSALPRVISYIPYGEIFVEQQSGGWQSPYLFNAKELDSETGLYYYGARYLDPTSATWLSVDPLWEKYAGMSPYGYCAGNPVRLVDVDGKIYIENEQSQSYFKEDMEKVFGEENVKHFKFDEKGKLYIDDMKQLTLSKNQKKILKEMKEFINSDDKLEYASNAQLKVDKSGTIRDVDILKEYGGGAYAADEKKIIIAPDVKDIHVNLAPSYSYKYENDDFTKSIIDVITSYSTDWVNVKENRASTLFHEIGELIYRGYSNRGYIIDFQNKARKELGLPERPYDLDHHNPPLKK